MTAINVEPLNTLVDDPVRITIKNLKPKQEITIYSSHTDEEDLFAHCIAHYVADHNGNVDLEKDPSIGGDYTGVEPMGLFWAMRRPYNRWYRYKLIRKRNVTTPQVIFISLYLEHIEEKDLDRFQAVSKVKVERWFMNDTVERIPVRHDRVRGVMFIPKDKGPYPGVIYIHGYDPGLFQSQASLLACHGFATFSVSYFGYEDLPEKLQEIDLEYFEEAIKIFRDHRKVLKGVMGLYGKSMGGTIVSALASYVPGISCVVNVCGPIFPFIKSIVYKDRFWPCIQLNSSKIYLKDGRCVVKDTLPVPCLDELGNSLIEIHNSSAAFLHIHGDSDCLLDTIKNATLARELIKLTNKSNYEIAGYPDAGHVIEQPYHPVVLTNHIRPYAFGGTPKGQAKANEESWNRVIKFFRKHLRISKL